MRQDQCTHQDVKSGGPYQVYVNIFGNSLNTVTMEASITPEKKIDLLHELCWMTHKNSCTKKELLSLINKLSFCCKFLPAGRMFLHRMIDLSTSVKNLNHHIPLTSKAQWYPMVDWLPTQMVRKRPHPEEWMDAITTYTDASGSHGWGAYWSGRWLQTCWTPAQQQMDTTWKELFSP